MELELYDSDEFTLRKVPILFFDYLSCDGKIAGLTLNQAVQMDAIEIRQLVGNAFSVRVVEP
jgi:hypothetical protein